MAHLCFGNSNIKMKVSMVRWRNDIDRVKLKFQSVQQKPYVNRAGNDPGPQLCETILSKTDLIYIYTARTAQ